jgi:pimeloyl-ACP methyl ester carboxylesterase
LVPKGKLVTTPTWVLLRGLTREARHWDGFPARLAQSLHRARVIALDLPGNGALHRLRSPPRIAAMATYCRIELHRLGIAPPYHLLAMSMGAMVATAWAMEAPQELAAAVLVNTSMRPFSSFTQRLRPENYAALLRLVLTRANDLAWERAVLAMTSRARTRDDAALLQSWVAYRREQPVSAANALRQLVAAARFCAPAANPFHRVLLLGSERDALVDVRCTRQLARHWACAMELHPWAGHDLPLDDPAWLVAQMRQRI